MKKLLGIIFVFVLTTCCGITVKAEEGTSKLPYIIENGSTYYESSYGFGSGRNASVSASNTYTTEPCYAGINGYSFLDENGKIIKFDYKESANDIEIPQKPEKAVKLFLHFKSTYYRNGWVDSENVTDKEQIEPDFNEEEQPKVQEPKEIVKNMRKDIKENKNKKTTIVIDFSGSMLDNQRQVVELLDTLELNQNITIIVFANEYEIVTQEQLASEDFYVGGGTFMIQALNEATSLETENLIVISDLDTHDLYLGSELKESKTLKDVVIYDPDDGPEDKIVDDLLKVTWKNATVSRIRIK